jgi:hypothetical protein
MWQQNGVGYPSFRPENMLLDEPSDDRWRGCESGIATHVYLSRCWEQMATVHQHHVTQPMTSYRHHSQTGFQSRQRQAIATAMCMLYQSSPITRHEIASFPVWLRCSSLQETTLRLLAPCQPKKSIDFICHVMSEDWY